MCFNKIMITAAVLLAAAGFAACGGSGPAAPASPAAGTPDPVRTGGAETPAPVASAVKNADGFVFEYGGSKIYMDEDMAGVLARLGEPRNVFEAPSCAFDGVDRVYDYPSIDIRTYPEGGTDFVHTVNLRDDGVTTPEGLYLGSGVDEVLAAYGNVYTLEMGLYTYEKGETYLSFLVENDEVISITYGLNLQF